MSISSEALGKCMSPLFKASGQNFDVSIAYSSLEFEEELFLIRWSYQKLLESLSLLTNDSCHQSFMNQQISELTSLTTLFQNYVASIRVLKSFQDKYIEVNFHALLVEYPFQDIQLLCLHEVTWDYRCLINIPSLSMWTVLHIPTIDYPLIAIYEIVIGKTDLWIDNACRLFIWLHMVKHCLLAVELVEPFLEDGILDSHWK